MFTVIKSQLSRSVPFAKLLGIAVTDVSKRDASVNMSVGPTLTNHVGTAHAGALFTACESASGAALAGALLPVIMQLRFVVRDARIDYLRPAKGELSAKAALVDEPALVLEQLQRTGRADVAVDVSAQTADGTVVAKASFNWNLKITTPP
jgi:thioesterase domain-containing protein